MPRPCKKRRVCFVPGCVYFKPAGVPMRQIREIVLSMDELESVRLADLEGLYQEDAARAMGVSRQTFANILKSARSKIARFLIKGLALKVEGGAVDVSGMDHTGWGCRWGRGMDAPSRRLGHDGAPANAGSDEGGGAEKT